MIALYKVGPSAQCGKNIRHGGRMLLGWADATLNMTGGGGRERAAMSNT